MQTIDKEFQIQQLNDKYIFNLKQEELKLIHVLQKSIDKAKKEIKQYADKPNGIISEDKTNLECIINKDHLIDSIKDLLKFKMKQDLLIFTFGKYKGRIVQDIINEDRTYCEWFSNNIIGKDFNTLKILDYIHKTLIARVGDPEYTDKNKPQELDQILLTLLPKEWYNQIDKQQILETKKSKGIIYDEPYLTPWEEAMYEIYDYGDFC